MGDVWPAIATMIMDQLTLADVSFDSGLRTDLPLISRTPSAADASADDGFVLPRQGAAIPVVAGHHTLGHVVIRPRPGITSLWIERRVVIALVDHLTIALTYAGYENATSERMISNDGSSVRS